MSDEDDLNNYRPVITEGTLVQAAEAYGRGDEILSLNGKRTANDSFVLVLANDTEPLGPFLMSATCARALCTLLVSEGFGP